MIIVVGAGPAGLATAYHLQKQNMPYCVLEKHTVGHTWSAQYDRLHLHTLKQVSALPSLPMPEDYPRFPSAEQHLAYLQEYARHFDLNIKTGVEVKQATYRHLDGWILETSQGMMRGDILIAATGIWSTPHRPHFENEATFAGEIIHASKYRNPQPFKGQRVLVVGGGNSGCEIAVDLNDHGVESSIAIRSGTEFVPFPSSELLVRSAAWFFRHVPPPVGEWVLEKVRRDFSHVGLQPSKDGHINTYPVVGFQLPEAVEAGRVILYDTGIAQFTESGVIFEDGRQASFDAVILATGYRPTLDFIDEKDLERSHEGQPCLNEQRQSTRNPKLYCVGYHYPATEGWLQAIGRVSRQVADSVRNSVFQVVNSPDQSLSYGDPH